MPLPLIREEELIPLENAGAPELPLIAESELTPIDNNVNLPLIKESELQSVSSTPKPKTSEKSVMDKFVGAGLSALSPTLGIIYEDSQPTKTFVEKAGKQIVSIPLGLAATASDVVGYEKGRDYFLDLYNKLNDIKEMGISYDEFRRLPDTEKEKITDSWLEYGKKVAEKPPEPEKFGNKLLRKKRELLSTSVTEDGVVPAIKKGIRKTLSYPEQFVSGFTGATVGGLAGIGGLVTGGEYGPELARKVQSFQAGLAPDDPNFFHKLSSGFGSLYGFYFPGKGIGTTASMFKSISPRTANWLSAGGAAIMEAGTEAGLVYNDELQKTGDAKKAEKAAQETFLSNVGIIALTNKLGIFGDEKSVIKKLTNSFVTEGFQEATQSIIPQVAKGEKIDTKDIAESALVGGITGGIVGGTSAYFDKKTGGSKLDSVDISTARQDLPLIKEQDLKSVTPRIDELLTKAETGVLTPKDNIELEGLLYKKPVWEPQEQEVIPSEGQVQTENAKGQDVNKELSSVAIEPSVVEIGKTESPLTAQPPAQELPPQQKPFTKQSFIEKIKGKTTPPKDINAWVLNKGGINFNGEHWKGELRDLRDNLNKGKRIGYGNKVIKSEGAYTLDQLAFMAKDEGYIQEATPQSLLDAMHGRKLHVSQAEDLIEKQGQEMGAGVTEAGQWRAKHDEIFSKDVEALTQDELQYHLTHDELTGLQNRKAFEKVNYLFTGILDLDGFKKVNDTFGHQKGNDYLKALGSELRNAGVYDSVYRLFGDEFGIKAQTEEQTKEIVRGFEKALQNVGILVKYKGKELVLHGGGFSHGIGQGEGTEALRIADAALYQNKEDRTRAGYRLAGDFPKGISFFDGETWTDWKWSDLRDNFNEGLLQEPPAKTAEGLIQEEKPASDIPKEANKQDDSAVKLEKAAEKLSLAAEKLTDTFLKIQEAPQKPAKPSQIDLVGVKTGLEGKLPTEEIKGNTALEQAVEDAKTREAQKGQGDLLGKQEGEAKSADLTKKEKGVEYPYGTEKAGEISDNKGKDLSSFADENSAQDVWPEVVSTTKGRVDAQVRHIYDSGDAALTITDLIKSPQERSFVILLDKKSKIIAVHEHSKGIISSSFFDSKLIAGVAINNKASSIVFVHNHPSGYPQLSKKDKEAYVILSDVLNGTGIILRDMIAVSHRGWEGINGEGKYIKGNSKSVKVKVIDREIKTFGGGSVIHGASEARDYATRANIDKGFLLLNGKNVPVGFVKVPEPAKLRGSQQRNILSELEKRNATSAIYIDTSKKIDTATVQNIINFGMRADITILDVIDNIASFGEMGKLPEKATGTFLSVEKAETAKPSPSDISETEDIIKNVFARIDIILGKENVETRFKPSANILDALKTDVKQRALGEHGLGLHDTFSVAGLYQHTHTLTGNGLKHIITFAEELKNNPKGLRATAFHEPFHGIKEILKQQATHGNKEAQAILDTLKKEFKNEEDEADAFADFGLRADKRLIMPQRIRAIFERIMEFFRSIGDYLTGKGITSRAEVNEFFKKAWEGEYADKTPLEKEVASLNIAKDTVNDFLEKHGRKLNENVQNKVKDDINEINDKINTPHYIADKNPEFKGVFNAAKQSYEKRDIIITDLLARESVYYDLPEGIRNRVDKANEAGTLQNKVWKPVELTLKFGLNKQGILAYYALRDKYATALQHIKDTYVELGVDPAKIDEVFKDLIGYTPLTRFGEWRVIVKQGDKLVSMQNFESESDAYTEANRLEKQYPRQKNLITSKLESPITVDRVVKTGATSIFEGVDPATLGLFSKIADIAPEVSDPFIDEVRDYIKKMGFKSHFIHREKVPGYSKDWRRVHADYTVGLAGYLSRLTGESNMKEALKDIDKDRQPKLFKYASDYIDYISNPEEEMSKLRGGLFLYYMGLNPKSATLNLTQSITTTLPYLGQYTPFASVKIIQASKDIVSAISVKNGAPFFDHSKLGKDVGDALKLAEREGIVSEQMVYGLMGIARGEVLSQEKHKIARALVYMFSTTETFNRRVAFVTAYRIGKQLEAKGKLPKGFDSVQKFAEDVVENTQFIYGKHNRPRIARGKVGATFFTFKMFSLSYIEMQVKLARAKGEDIRRGQFIKALGIMFALAGLSGLPFADDIKKLLEFFFGVNYDVKIRDLADEVLGDPEYGEIIMKGITRLGPIDMSGSIGLGDIIPDVDTISIIGPAGGILKRLSQAPHWVDRGEYLRALETISPEMLRNPLAAYRLKTEGHRNKRGELTFEGEGRWNKDINVAAKALSFQPSDWSRANERERAQAMIGGKRAVKKQEFVDRLARAYVDSNQTEVSNIQSQIKDYNKGKKIEDQIIIAPAELKSALIRRRMPEDMYGLKSAPKQKRQEYQRIKELFK